MPRFPQKRMVLTRAASKRKRERREIELKRMEAERAACERKRERREVEWQRAKDEYLQTLYDTIEQHTGFPKGVVNITRDYCTVLPLVMTLLVTGLADPCSFGLADQELTLNHPDSLLMLTRTMRLIDGDYYDRIVYTVETTTSICGIVYWNLNLRDMYFWDGMRPNISEWFFPTQVVIRRSIRPPTPPTSPRKVYPSRKLQSKAGVSKP